MVGWLAIRQRSAVGARAHFGMADALTLARGAVAAHLVGISACSRRKPGVLWPARGTAATHVVGISGYSRRKPGTRTFARWRPEANPPVRAGAFALLIAVTILDWTDGWLARKLGTNTRWGEKLDLEVDSWLTLCAAWTSVWVGGLPGVVALAPALRYLASSRQVISADGGDGSGTRSWWARASGACQMGLFILSLAPFAHRRLRQVLRVISVPVACLSLASLLAQHGRTRRVMNQKLQGEQLQP
jgi:phosphatidylglycerophosphate synthase